MSRRRGAARACRSGGQASATCLTALLAALLAPGGCGSDSQRQESSSPPPASPRTPETPAHDPEAIEPEHAGPQLIQRSRPMMGTVFQITVSGKPEAVAEPAIRRALDEIARLEQVLSEWIDGSEISRINAEAGHAPVHVSEDTFRVVKAGLDVSRWSDGAFDLSWAALRGLYDFREGHEHVPDTAEIRRRLPLINWHDIVIDEDAHTVFLRRSGMAIGTGGIGKGYALDRAGEVLREAGIEDYMVFGGGQVQVHGRKGDRRWRVGIQHPRRADRYFAMFEADAGSISTSGDYEHYFIDPQGRRWHHILDPRTGLPVDRTFSVTILCPSGLYADALSTAVFVLGPEAGVAMLARIQDEMHAEAVIVDPQLRVTTTPETRSRLVFTEPLVDGRIPN